MMKAKTKAKKKATKAKAEWTTGDIGVAALLARVADENEATTLGLVLDLAEALRERLPDDLGDIQVDGYQDEEFASTKVQEICDLCHAIRFMWEAHNS